MHWFCHGFWVPDVGDLWSAKAHRCFCLPVLTWEVAAALCSCDVQWGCLSGGTADTTVTQHSPSGCHLQES